MLTIRKTFLSGLALLSASALLAGCASAPKDSETPGGDGKKTDFSACMVSDAGGFDDHSFNELGKTGIDKAGEEIGFKPTLVESADENAYTPNIQSLLDKNCNYIVTVGFALSQATIEAAKANPDSAFAIVDDAADADFDGKADAPNIKPLLFDTAQAAFLGGYAAASYSSKGAKKVGTFGGMDFPTVSIFMDGFAQGVAYWNEQKKDNVEVIGWDHKTKKGSFTGGFEANDQAKVVAQGIIDQGVDVILPVGGPIYISAAAAIKDAKREIAMIGVDADVYETDPKVAPLLLTSIRKLIDAGCTTR